jgi:uncharacterized protein (TIGR03437 family)
MLRKSLVACLVFFALAASVLEAQNVFALPGSASTAQVAQVYYTNPLSPITGVSTGPGAFLVLAAAQKFYIVQNSISVGVTDGTFATVRSIGSFSQAPTGAVISPDGKRLAVAAGTLHFFDTSSDTELTSPTGLSVGSGIRVSNVTVGLDGTTFYSLGTNSVGASTLSSINTATLSVTGSLAIQGTAIFLTVGRNGLVYVGTQNPNQVLEINPGTLTVTPGGTITLSGAPNSMVFTADGLYALVSYGIGSGSLVSSIALANHSVLNGIPFSSIGSPIASMQIMGSSAVAAYSSGNQGLYEILLSAGGTISNIITFPGISSGVTAFAVSNEVPAGSVPAPSALFASATGTLDRVDLASGSISQISLPNATGALSFAAQAVTGSQPSTLLQYGSGQTVAPGSASLPLVVQVLDSGNRPLSGVTVTFTAFPTSAVVSPTAATTGSNGYAVAYLTAPSTAGTVQVTATAGTKTSVFNLTVAATAPANNLKIVAGQGQMLPLGTNTANAVNAGSASIGSHLTVLVSDSNGNPVSASAVTFSINSGGGGITLGPGQVSNPSATVTTDSNGLASVDFVAPNSALEIATKGFGQTTVVATSGLNSVTFYMTITPQLGSSPPQPSALLITPDPGSTLSGQVGTILLGAVKIRVTSPLGFAVPNVGIMLTNGGLDPVLFPSASCNDPIGAGVLTDSTGLATCDLVFGPKIGPGSERVVVGYFPITNPFNIVVTAGPPAKVNIIGQGNNQSGSPGQTLPFPLVVQVTDAGGNTLSGVPVTWQVVTAGTVTLKNVINTTDANGRASASATLGNVAGAQQVTVTAGTASATFTLTVNIAAAGIRKVSGDGQTALIGTVFGSPLVVKVVDANGNAATGVLVTFAVTAGSATLGSATATDSTGQTSTTVTAGSSAGAITVTATTAGFSTSFSLTARLPGPSNITIYNGPNFAAGFTIQSISPGSIATITGTGIATGVQGLVVANNIIGPLPTTLAGVSVTFNGTAAPIYFVLNSNGKEQVTVQVPFEVQPGAVSVTINGATGGSTTVNATVQALAPGAFTTTYGNQTVAVAQRPDGSYVSPSNPAHPGDNITFYVTGLGQVTPATGTGQAGVPSQNVVAQLAVAIHTSSGTPASATGAQLISAVYAPGLVGVYAVTVQIPADTATGPAQLFVMIAYDSQNNPYFLQGVQIPIQ